MTVKAWTTQYLANAFPQWSRVRTDEQSLGQQILNSIGENLDDISKQIARIGDNYFLPTSIVGDIDVYYQYRLPGSFTFTKEEDDDTDFQYTAPTVSGTIGDQLYAVSMAANNDIESFWYDAIPDRWSLGAVASGQHLIASGYSHLSPISPVVLSGICHIPNQLHVTVSGGTSYLGIEDNGLIRKGTVQIEGETRAGLAVTEEMIFLHDDTIKTQYDYKKISVSGVRIFGAEEADETFVTVQSAFFNHPEYKTAYDIAVDINDEEIPSFWKLGSGHTAGTYTLDLYKYTSPLDLRIEGFIDKEVIIQQELRTSSGINFVPLDLAVEPRSEHIWMIDANNLFLFNDSLPYPDLSVMTKKSYDANCYIEPETYYAVYGQTIGIDFVWARPTLGLVKHRVWVVKPDDTKYLVNEDGTESAWSSTTWIVEEPHSRVLRPTAYATLDQRGQYIYSLEAYYTDGSSSIDQRVIYVVAKNALKDFSLESISQINGAIVGVDVDAENHVWVLDNQGVKYRIDMHYDNMLIDFEKKVLYFREPYDTVRVIE